MKEYEKIRKIGRGSYGKVFLCRHKKTHQEVADKRIDMDFLSDKERAMVFEEAKIMDMFSRSHHPHVVVFIEHYQARGVCHFYMEYCAGGSLEEELKRMKDQQQKYEETQIMSYIYQIANGLAFIHGKKVIHRDLKPANILKSGEGMLKIADFGVGTALTRTGSQRKTKAGTMAYMAPEIIQGEKAYSYECDVWSLGVTVYEMLKFRLPFPANNEFAMSKNIIGEPFEPLDNSVSCELNTLLTGTMKKNPSDRPSSKAISELGFILAAYEDTQGVSSAVERLNISEQRPTKTKPVPTPQPKPNQQPEEHFKTLEEMQRWSDEWDASDKKKYYKYTLLHYVCGKGVSAAVIAALCLRDDIEAKCQYKMEGGGGWSMDSTPLHVASWSGDVDVVKALLDHKADIEAKNTYNETPLHMASANGHVEVVKVLLDHKADIIEAKSSYKETPLHWASRRGQVEVFKILVQRGADFKHCQECRKYCKDVGARK